MSGIMFFVIAISVSFLGILLLFFCKAFDKNFFTGVDPKSQKVIDAFKFRVKQVVQTTRYIIFVLIPRRSEESFAKTKTIAVREFNKKKEVVLGKKDLKDGGASFFLKKMKEEMKTVKSGKIEDDSLLVEEE
jgi:hypothetical protein